MVFIFDSCFYNKKRITSKSRISLNHSVDMSSSVQPTNTLSSATIQPPQTIGASGAATINPTVATPQSNVATTTVPTSRIATAIPRALRVIANNESMRLSNTAAQLQTVSELITAPSAARLTNIQPDGGLTDQIIVPILPDGSPDLTTRAWALRLAACFRSNKTYNVRQTAGIVIALFYVLYPETTRKTRDTEWIAYILTAKEVENVNHFLSEGALLPDVSKDKTTTGMQTLVAAITKMNTERKIDHTLPIGAVSHDFFKTQRDWLMFHGFAGLIIFTMHKDAKAGSGKALLNARPLALRQKYSKDEKEYVLWSDLGRPQSAAYVACTAVWKIIPQTRLYLMSEFVTSSSGSITAEREALFTTVRLMRWTDASHIVIINEALNTFPYLRACPFLTGDLAAFSAGMKQIYEMMPEYTDPVTHQRVKDTTTMPYIKALYGDKRSIAQRNTMQLLLAVALKMLSPLRPTLSGYTGPTGLQVKVDSILTWHAQVLEMMNDEGL